jgi:hypothetical protein
MPLLRENVVVVNISTNKNGKKEMKRESESKSE